MEVVLAASAAANVAIVLIERFSNRETVTEEKQDVASEGTQALQELQTETEEVVTDPQVEETDAPEGSVRALEIRLKELRAQAKQLNSPDTFVQYARVSREANKVEKELLEKKGKNEINRQTSCLALKRLRSVMFHNLENANEANLYNV